MHNYKPARSIEVLKVSEDYLKNNSTIEEKISELNWAYNSISKLIPTTMENFTSGHLFPYMESWDELQISFNLMMFGFYKQSFISLRNALELGLLSVYYNINDEGHHEIQEWLRSKETWEAQTPRADKIWRILTSNENINSFERKFNLRKRFDELGFLHNYVHTKGIKFSNRLGILKSNFQTFEIEFFEKWIETYSEIITIIITLHILKFPIAVYRYNWYVKCGIDNPYPVLDESEINRILGILPNDYAMSLIEIGESDKNSQELFNYILNLPDITEDEVERQRNFLDKSMIEGMGFIEWEKNELRLIERFNTESKNKALERLKVLKLWAIENNKMEPKFKFDSNSKS
jgi:hypothetical protein